MAELCKFRRTCRLCGYRTPKNVFNLTPTPPANAFIPENALNEEQLTFPLNVYFCENCAHVQLLDVVDPSILFEDYVYVSGTSPSFVSHFAEYALSVSQAFASTDEGGLVIDIGSNDGTLLHEFKKLGFDVLGIDPARDIAARASANGIETLARFFTPSLAEDLVNVRGPAKLITANNVFAHANDLKGITRGVRTLLAPDGIFIFEVSYLADVFKKTLFDTIYHEHLAYHSVKPLKRFFTTHGLDLFRAERVNSHGGSLRGFVQHKGAPREPDGSIDSLINFEENIRLDQAESYVAYADRINALKEKLGYLLRDIKSTGKTIAGFGAPAKSTTLMYHFGIGADLIDFIVDDSPLKQGLYSPGLHVPILSPDALYDKSPNVVLILAWNFAESIMKNHSRFRDQGGQFIIPLPDVEIC